MQRGTPTWKMIVLLALIPTVMATGCGGAGDDRRDEQRQASAGADSHGEAGAPEIRWASDWTQAFEQAQATDRPVLASFYADWCVWCKRLETKTFNDQRVAQLVDSGLVAVKLDVDGAGKQLARNHGVQGLPTVVLFAPGGDEIGRVDGYLPAKDFLSVVEPMLQTGTGG